MGEPHLELSSSPQRVAGSTGTAMLTSFSETRRSTHETILIRRTKRHCTDETILDLPLVARSLKARHTSLGQKSSGSKSRRQTSSLISTGACRLWQSAAVTLATCVPLLWEYRSPSLDRNGPIVQQWV